MPRRSERIIVLSAREEHMKRVTEIAHENALGQVLESEERQYGFLTADLNEEEYREYLQETDYFYVVEVDGRIEGFVLACESGTVRGDNEMSRLLSLAYPEAVLIRQVCVSRDRVSQGIGRLLYQRLFLTTGELAVVAVVVVEPLNGRSVGFHQKMGFSPIEELMSDGKRRVAFLRRPFDTRILLDQYKEALGLYCHEDTLRWEKLSYLFYVTTGLFAVLAFPLGSSEDPERKDELAVAVSLFGVLISIIFGASIRFGTDCMRRRLVSARRLEHHLLQAGGSAFLYDDQFNIDRRTGSFFSSLIGLSPVSTTTRVLGILPFVLAIGWAILALYLVVF